MINGHLAIECFLFYNELDLLELKLEYTTTVDKFLLLEFPTSYMRVPRRMHFEENKARFEKYGDRIVHKVITSDPPGLGLHLFHARREILVSEAKAAFSGNDTVIFSDPDVVLRPECIEKIQPELNNQLLTSWRSYYLNGFWGDAIYPFTGAIRLGNVQSMATYYHRPPDVDIKDCGWHFSKLGGIQGVIDNVTGYPHADLDREDLKNPDLVAARIRDGITWDGRTDSRVVYKPFVAEDYPAYVSQHPEIYEKHIWRE
jgi:hypothetical protein